MTHCSHLTAKDSGYVLCHDCHKLGKQSESHCSRCQSPLHKRIPKSLEKTWALLITAYILIIPANLLPVMSVFLMGNGEADTIISGVIHLASAGMIPIAILVFVASIVVPFIKLFLLTWLLLAIQFNWRINKVQCTVLYRIVSFIGRWSMLDLFMVSILVTLVHLGSIATINAGAGATAFATVVVLTMFAANTFDPRLLWDLEEKSENASNGK